jgi:hypothetical protein
VAEAFVKSFVGGLELLKTIAIGMLVFIGLVVLLVFFGIVVMSLIL